MLHSYGFVHTLVILFISYMLAYVYDYKQDKLFRHKRLSTGANFVHVCIEIWDKGILKFNQISM